jgi:UDP-glucose 4-epimerase
VVVVGATGNVGTSVVQALGADPDLDSIVGVARRLPSWQPAKTEWVARDVAEDELDEAFRDADAVIHLAWLFQPTHTPAITWGTNVLGSIRVFAAAARAGVRALIHASSVGAYSPAAKDEPVDESWPTDGWPEAAYAREKAYLERVLDAFELQHPDIRVVRMRPAFLFKPQASDEQRRLFAGPLLPNALVRPAVVPIVPDFPGLRFQALHTDDAAEAYRLAVHSDVRGAFNLAAEPVVDARLLADCLDARVVRVPMRAVRAAGSLLWHLHLVPASPYLFDLVLRVPIMRADRAGRELGWAPQHSSGAAIEAFLEGLRTGTDLPTPPLSSPLPGGRLRELRTGVGERP